MSDFEKLRQAADMSDTYPATAIYASDIKALLDAYDSSEVWRDRWHELSNDWHKQANVWREIAMQEGIRHAHVGDEPVSRVSVQVFDGGEQIEVVITAHRNKPGCGDQVLLMSWPRAVSEAADNEGATCD